jgi:outer membrane protein assembly factor BamA
MDRGRVIRSNSRHSPLKVAGRVCLLALAGWLTPKSGAQSLDAPGVSVGDVGTVLERPNSIREIIYQNANHISQKDLEEMTRLHKGAPLDIRLVQQARREIEDALKKQGRYFAHVSILEGDKPKARRVVFNITEGPGVRVRQTLFTGNKELASDRLRAQIVAGRTFLGIGNCRWNLAMVNDDVLRIEEHYRGNGYLDARVTRELVFTPDLRFVDVIFHIVEGQRYRVESVHIHGASLFDRADIASVVRLRQGDYYNEGCIRKDLRNVTEYYNWRGYQVDTKRQWFYSNRAGWVWVVYEVEEKMPAKGENPIVSGAVKGQT